MNTDAKQRQCCRAMFKGLVSCGMQGSSPFTMDKHRSSFAEHCLLRWEKDKDAFLAIQSRSTIASCRTNHAESPHGSDL
ncbi:MAG: hypothetical protein Q4B32_07400 [Clostridia bacterium]|nr:hypothetical protein [Clostridia bacterium]